MEELRAIINLTKDFPMIAKNQNSAMDRQGLSKKVAERSEYTTSKGNLQMVNKHTAHPNSIIRNANTHRYKNLEDSDKYC